MSSLKRLFKSVKKQGFLSTFLKFYLLVFDRFYDLRYGIDTSRESILDALSIQGENGSRGNPYVPTRIVPLRKLFRLLKPFISPDSVLVDYGSGKGRVLFVASEYGVKEARGIEFAHELSAVACRNSTTYAARSHTRTRFDIIETDATTYPIQADENVFFMNNPFDRVVLSKVLENMRASLRQYPRKIYILYFTPTKKEVIDASDDFQRIRDGSVWGYDFILYTNCR